MLFATTALSDLNPHIVRWVETHPYHVLTLGVVAFVVMTLVIVLLPDDPPQG